MPKMTPGYAKNTITRSLRTILDPEPKEQEISQLWEFFKNKCAYCGCSLDRKSRQGHVDHLIPATEDDTTNHISNRVLSCRSCNGDEKGGAEWEKFLRTKTKNGKVFKARRGRIKTWVSSKIKSRAAPIDINLLKRETERAIKAFYNAVVRLRKSKDS